MGHILVTYAVSALLYVTIEAPIRNLEKYIFIYLQTRNADIHKETEEHSDNDSSDTDADTDAYDTDGEVFDKMEELVNKRRRLYLESGGDVHKLTVPIESTPRRGSRDRFTEL